MTGFPDAFLFGTATSATQIEGGCRSTDWWEFAQAGRVARGEGPDVACDHWSRYREDITLQTRLGMGAHRMSLEWGRIEPEEGRTDVDALTRYRDEILALRAAGIEPWVTLHHFSFPSWLARRGGLMAPDMPQRFEAFVRRVARALADCVESWLTINEPNVLIAQGYLLGQWPPGLKAPARIPRGIAQLRSAHVLAYRALHELVPNARVGIAHHARVATAATERLRDRATAGLLDRVFNRPFLDLPQDFIGLNYYTRDIVRFAANRPLELFAERSVAEGAELSDLGWEIYPAGLGHLLTQLSKRGKPIYVTENGIADQHDLKRPRFLLEHLREIRRAIARGSDVRGYFHWSLLDNFEWAEGYAPRFGLYAVDYATQTRTLRPSGELYARIAKERRCD